MSSIFLRVLNSCNIRALSIATKKACCRWSTNPARKHSERWEWAQDIIFTCIHHCMSFSFTCACQIYVGFSTIAMERFGSQNVWERLRLPGIAHGVMLFRVIVRHLWVKDSYLSLSLSLSHTFTLTTYPTSRLSNQVATVWPLRLINRTVDTRDTLNGGKGSVYH